VQALQLPGEDAGLGEGGDWLAAASEDAGLDVTYPSAQVQTVLLFDAHSLCIA
jgi:hypothetical protein